MNVSGLIVSAAMLLAAAPQIARAQSSAPTPAPTASAPGQAKPGPAPQSPAEKLGGATPPDEGRPAGEVTPQVAIPLGTKTAAEKPEPAPAGRAASAAAGGIDDGAARCEALADKHARARCRGKLTHPTP